MRLKSLVRLCVHAAWLLVLLVGCASVPERELENAFKYQRLKNSELSIDAAIPSEYQDLAVKAWNNADQGGDQYLSILEVGDDALLARIHLIRSAKRSIDLQTFIWVDDPTTRFVFDELVRAAERGVLVRVLIDGMSKVGTPEHMARMAHAHRNLEICLYKPLSKYAQQGRFGFWDNVLFKTRRMNRRMHNKLLLVDGRIGIAGGRNYQDKYYDRNTSFLFRDRDVLVAGPAVLDMQDSYELFWQDKNAVFLTQLLDVQAAFENLEEDSAPFADPIDAWMFAEINVQANAREISSLRDSLDIYGVKRVEFIYDTPRKFRGSRERMDFDDFFASIIERAEHQLVYQTPYLIYNRQTRKAFASLHKKNDRFRIIASSNSLAAADHIAVYALSFKHRKELYKRSGIDIYESKPYPESREIYVPTYIALAQQAAAARESKGEEPKTLPDRTPEGPRLCIHAKSFVLDSHASLIGSHNFDPRSSKLNTECGVFIEDDEVAQVLEKRILNACNPGNSWVVSKAPTVPVISAFSGFLGGISSALPFFDVWPYRYTTNYELKEGKTPLPPRDPAFQENYIDVGYFPEVPESGTIITTRLMKAFGGWARPLM